MEELVTPVEKVITLMEELKTEVEDEGKAEAKTYDTFACFCKDTTKDKSDAIETEQDNIESFAASMQENTENSAAKAVEIAELEDEIAATTKHIEQLTKMREEQLAARGSIGRRRRAAALGGDALACAY